MERPMNDDLERTPDGCGDLELPSAARILARPAVRAALAGSEPAATHIGCRFNHAHRWPDCYDEAYKPDIFDRLMALWHQPWTEEAFGEAQMLVARLRAALAGRAQDYDDHDWSSTGSPTYCRGCHITFPAWERAQRLAQEELASTPTASPTEDDGCPECGGGIIGKLPHDPECTQQHRFFAAEHVHFHEHPEGHRHAHAHRHGDPYTDHAHSAMVDAAPFSPDHQPRQSGKG